MKTIKEVESENINIMILIRDLGTHQLVTLTETDVALPWIVTSRIPLGP